MADQQAGWYPDPSGDVTKLRYWNGTQWTDDFTNNPSNPSTPAYYAPQPAYAQTQTASTNDQTLRLVAFVFCIISTIASAILIVPLIWMIPMSVMCWGIYKGTRANTTAFGVCTLIFVSLVAGILLLVSKKDA